MEQSTSESNPRVQVQLAYTRTYLASERTFAAWLRTGLSVAAAGFAMTKLVSGPALPIAITIGVILVLIGAAIILFGAWSFRRVCGRLSGAEAPPSPLSLWMVNLVSGLLAALLIGVLFLV